MRSIRILGALILFLAFVVPAYANDQDGADLFKVKCTSCHGDDGKGTAAGKKLGVPVLSDDAIQDLSDKILRGAVANGKHRMPAFGAELSQDQIVDVVIHVRSFWTPKVAAK